VLNCAYGYKETKTSLLGTKESFGVSINFAARYDGRSESIQINKKSKGA